MTIRKISLLILFTITVTCFSTAGNKKEYRASNIPAPLLTRANTVVRHYSSSMVRNNLKSLTEEVHYVVTVLNKAGENSGNLTIPYFKSFSTVTNITAVIYDANGNKVKSVKKDDVLDFSPEAINSLYSNLRYKIINIHYATYPYTVEYSYTRHFRETMFIPAWEVFPDYYTAVENAEFSLEIPDDTLYKINFYRPDTSFHIIKKRINNKTGYYLSVKNLPAVSKEEYTPGKIQDKKIILLSPEYFKIKNFEGSFKSWNDFGKFIAMLNRDHDRLDEESSATIKSMITGIDDTSQIVSTLYRYMQKKVRYVSEQKGIGGWQPYEASKVDEMSYGDCKALTNYMKSLLKTVGIKSYYTLVSAGQDADNIITDFPSNQFNHAILCVPLRKDTVWLECTSPYLPPDYLGSFTDDRDVLLINENSGGYIVHTPVYGKEINEKNRKTEVWLNQNNADIKIVTVHKGIFYDKTEPVYLQSYNRQKQEILSRLHFPTITLKDFHINKINGDIPQIVSEVNLEAGGLFTKAGNRLIITPFLFSKEEQYHFRNSQRRNNIYVKREYRQTDTVVFHLTEKHKAPSGSKEYSLNTRYGSYHASLTSENNTLVYTRQLTVNKGLYPASDWEEFKAFFINADIYDNIKTVIQKTE